MLHIYIYIYTHTHTHTHTHIYIYIYIYDISRLRVNPDKWSSTVFPPNTTVLYIAYPVDIRTRGVETKQEIGANTISSFMIASNNPLKRCHKIRVT